MRLLACVLAAALFGAAPSRADNAAASAEPSAAAVDAAALERSYNDPQGMLASANAALDEALLVGDGQAELQARYHRLLSQLAAFDRPDPSTPDDIQRSEELARQLGDKRRLAAILTMRGSPAMMRGVSKEESARSFAESENLIDANGFDNLRIQLRLTRSMALIDEGRRAESLIEAMAAHKEAVELPSRLLSAIALVTAARGCCIYPGASRADLERGIEYMRAALAVADPDRHRAVLFVIHAGLGRSLAQLKRHEEALPHLRSEIALAQALRDKHAAAYAMIGTARVERDLGRPQSALDWLDKAQALLREGVVPEPVSLSLHVGRARVLAQLGRRQESLAALDIARGMMESFPVIPGEATIFFQEAAAEVHALAGDNRAAYEAMRALRQAEKAAEEQADQRLMQRVQAESVTQLKDAENARLRAEQKEARARRLTLAVAAGMSTLLLCILAVWHWQRSRQARQHATYLQAIAAEEGRRAVLLAESKATLERLAAVGQEITAHLDERTVFCALHRHVGVLLDAPSIAMWTPAGDGSEELLLRFGVEDGQPLPPLRIALNHPTSHAARSARERREILAERAPDETDPAHVPGTRIMLTAMFAPLVSGGHLHGVLSIQSARAQAYGERERQVFRTLCAYGAVALANAAGAHQLAQAQTELAREKMRNMLVHAGKMVTIGRLASGLVHEMAHPVGTVTLLNETAQALLADSRCDDARNLMHSIERETDRLQGLIRRLRDFARSDAPGLVEVNVLDVLADAKVLFTPRLRMERVQYDESVGLAVVVADPDRLALVIANVVFNAIDAMSVSDAATRRAIEVRSDAEGGMLRLTLRDFGPGLSSDAQDRLFEPFFTTKPQGKGLGLGLAMSAESMASMNGRIEACNHPEGGAVFTLVLPVVSRAAA